MSFYIDDSDYDSDVDNIHNDISYEPNIVNESEYKEQPFTLLDDSFDWVLKRMVCFDHDKNSNSLSRESLSSFNIKKIESEKIFECMKCAECKKNNITTTFCCLLRNESYYFCNSECWSSWINGSINKNDSNPNLPSASNDFIETAEQIISNS